MNPICQGAQPATDLQVLPGMGACRPPLTSATPGISSLSHRLMGKEEACVEDLTILEVEINSLPGTLVRFCE